MVVSLFGVAEEASAAQSPGVGRDVRPQIDGRDEHEIGALGLLVDGTCATSRVEQLRLIGLSGRHGRYVNDRHGVEEHFGARLDQPHVCATPRGALEEQAVDVHAGAGRRLLNQKYFYRNLIV